MTCNQTTDAERLAEAAGLRAAQTIGFRDGYAAGMRRAMEIVLTCSDETCPVEVFREIQKELP